MHLIGFGRNKRDEEVRELAVHLMDSLMDVAREAFLVLDADLRVLAANPTFCQDFNVVHDPASDTPQHLCDCKWDIPEVWSLLETLPEKKVVKDYEVTHEFEDVGTKTILLNAKELEPARLIVLAIEDITDKKDMEDKIAVCTSELEERVAKRTEDLAAKVEELERVNKSMVGRELRMIELKKDIEKLQERIKGCDCGVKKKNV